MRAARGKWGRLNTLSQPADERGPKREELGYKRIRRVRRGSEESESKKSRPGRRCVHADQGHNPTRTRGTRFGIWEGHIIRKEVDCLDEIRDRHGRTKATMNRSKREEATMKR